MRRCASLSVFGAVVIAIAAVLLLTSLSAAASDTTGRWKWGSSGCYFDDADDGPDQCNPNDPPPPTGRYKLTASGCVWDANDSGPDQCSPNLGHYKLNASGCYWASNESGANQCSPSSGRYKLAASGCVWDWWDSGANQCSPYAGRYRLNATGCYWDSASSGANECSPTSGRYKLNLTGCYWDAGDSGTNQCSPASGRYKLNATGCYWDWADSGPNQCNTAAGRYKLNATGCYWDAADTGTNQCSPATGRYKLNASGCYWDTTDSGPNQCSPSAGRYKLGPAGCYWDPSDSGPQQCSPATGRYKLNSSGCYWDGADSGPAQCSPTSGRYKQGPDGCYWDWNDDGPAQCVPGQQNPPAPAPVAHTLRVEGDHFTVDGTKRFLLLATYNDALRATSSAVLDADFRYLRSIGLDGIRVYPNWWHYGCALTPASDDALFTTSGTIRDSAKVALLRVLDRAMANGLVVDLTFTRETVTGDPAGISFANYLAQVTAVAQLLAGGYSHVFFDLQNEYDLGGRLADADIPVLLAAIRLRDPLLGPRRLVTVSSSSPTKAGQIAANAGLDVAAVHDPRDMATWYQNAGPVIDTVATAMGGRRLPIYFQEPMPFSAFGSCGNQADSTRGHARQAATDAKAHGAAAWLFHTRRPFKLDATGYRAQLDVLPDERAEIESLRAAVDASAWGLATVGTPPQPTLTINGQPAPSIVVIDPGQTLTVAIANTPGNAGDWVGLYRKGADPRQYLEFKFVANGLNTLPAAGSTHGTMTFTIADAGLYEVRVYADRDFVLLRSSGTISVVAPLPTGRWKWEAGTCVWVATDSGPNQCVPVSTNAERLLSGVRLQPGQSRLSANRKYKLIYQATDGNVVLYRETDNQPIWATNKFLVQGYLEMQVDGNLVQCDSSGVPRWSAIDNSNHPGGTLEVQVDGNLVLSDANGPYWASETAEPPVITPPGPLGGTDVITYYSLDAMGSVRLLTDAQGTQLNRFDYLPFGTESTAPAQGDRRSFAGKQRDRESGFDYFGARYYSNQTGRFTTVDPIIDTSNVLADPQRWNRYGYALNNPLKFTDPDGRNPLLIMGGAGATVFGGWQIYQNWRRDRPWYEDVGTEAAKGLLLGATLGLAGPTLIGANTTGIGGITTAATVAGPLGTVSASELQGALRGGGPTLELVTKLTQSPATGRALSAAVGDDARALAAASRTAGNLYKAEIPMHAIRLLEKAGLVTRSLTRMNGVQGLEYRFRPEAMKFLAQYFEEMK